MCKSHLPGNKQWEPRRSQEGENSVGLLWTLQNVVSVYEGDVVERLLVRKDQRQRAAETRELMIFGSFRLLPPHSFFHWCFKEDELFNNS